MSVLKKLFSGKPALSEEEMIEEMRAVLRDAEQIAVQAPKAAMKLVRRKSKHLEDVIKIGRPMHNEFRNAVLPIMCQAGSGPPVTELPTVTRVPWEQALTVGALGETARTVEEEIIYLGPSDPRRDADAVNQLQALYQFAENPNLAVVVVGEETFLVRKSVAVSAAETLDPESEEVIVDVMDFAKSQGLESNIIIQ